MPTLDVLVFRASGGWVFGHVPGTPRTFVFSTTDIPIYADTSSFSQAGDGFVYARTDGNLVYSAGSGTTQITLDANGNTISNVDFLSTLGAQSVFMANTASVPGGTVERKALFITDDGDTPRLLLPDFNIGKFLIVGDYAYAVGSGPIGEESDGDLYRVDANGNAELIADEDPNDSDPSEEGILNIGTMFEFEDDLYFYGFVPNETHLYHVDSGTGIVTRQDGVPGSSETGLLSVADDRFYFWDTLIPDTGFELYVSDGVSWEPVKDINAGSGSGAPDGPLRQTAALGSKLIFLADAGGPEGTEVWVSDGSSEGTFALTGQTSGGSLGNLSFDSTFKPVTVEGLGLTFFRATSSTAGTELFATDGTVEGTRIFNIDLFSGSSPFNLVTDGEVLYFSIRGFPLGGSGSVWVSDGTPAGTHAIRATNTSVSNHFAQGPDMLGVFQLDRANLRLPQEPTTDFTGDGTADILWRETATNTFGAFEMDSGGPIFRIYGTAGADWTVAGKGDFTGDGISDILWQQMGTNTFGAFEMDTGSAIFKVYATAGDGWEVIGTGDFTGDGTIDVLWRETATNTFGAFEMDTGSAVFEVYGTAGAGWRFAGTGDFTGDGIADILWRETATNTIGAFEMDTGSAIFELYATASEGWNVVDTGDITGDGTSDIVWHHAATNSYGAFEMDSGTATFQTYGSPFAWKIVGTGDFTGDGSADILLHHTASNQISAYEMDGAWPLFQHYTTAGAGWELA